MSSSKSTSAKSRKVARTQYRLHELTAAAPTGAGETAARGHKINTGKQARIWDAKVEAQSIEYGTQQNQWQHAEPRPSVERFQHSCITKLRKKLETLCKQEANVMPPVMAWERWQSCSKLREELQKRAITNLILPEDAAAADPGLVADLMRSSVPQEAATKIARALSRESSRQI